MAAFRFHLLHGNNNAGYKREINDLDFRICVEGGRPSKPLFLWPSLRAFKAAPFPSHIFFQNGRRCCHSCQLQPALVSDEFRSSLKFRAPDTGDECAMLFNMRRQRRMLECRLSLSHVCLGQHGEILGLTISFLGVEATCREYFALLPPILKMIIEHKSVDWRSFFALIFFQDPLHI